MPWFISRVTLHRATAQNYLDLHEHMAVQGLYPTFKQDGFRQHLPDGTYAKETDETLVQMTARIKKALAAANYKAANPDVEKPPAGTYSFAVIGPSADFDHEGLYRTIIKK